MFSFMTGEGYAKERFEPVAGRIFAAIPLPDYVTGAVDRVREGEEQARGLSWVQPEKQHLTLAFLGEVDPERQVELVRRLPEVTVRPFYLSLEGLGVFPRKGRPQVLWAGLAPTDPLLFQLHGKIERITLDLGFEPERRRFHPHVTIARCGFRAEATVTRVMKKHREFGTAPFQVNEFVLYASQLGPRGSVYTELLKVSLE